MTLETEWLGLESRLRHLRSGTNLELKDLMSTAARSMKRRNFVSVCLFAFVLASVAFSSRTFAGPVTCEDLFRKEKFIHPSIWITETGRVEAKLTNSDSALGRFLNSLTRLIYKPLTIDRIEQMTERLQADKREIPFWEKFSEAFGLEVRIDPRALDKIPRTGALIVVANHAMNGVEGIALAAIVSKVRPDVKVVLTSLLDVIPGVAENSIFVNPYLGEQARLDNVEGRRQMAQDLRDGHALIIFPTGTVSGKKKLLDKEAVDARWRKGVAILLREVPETTVLPIFVEGQPGHAFLNVAYVSETHFKASPTVQKMLSVPLHIREVGKRIGTDVGLIIGDPIAGTEINSWGNSAQIMNRLRQMTLDLKGRAQEPRAALRSIRKPERRIDEIAPQGDMALVQGELALKGRVIFDMAPDDPQKRMKVILAKGRDIPETKNELGRLREITFRNVGEGSGRSRDLDGFDDHYDHLVVIDKKTGDIAGGYRLGRIDEILKSTGPDGIYTGLFFDHSKLVQTYLRTSLELGRSFVVPKYQRSFALLALFNAIGRFVVENPKYKYLMGPVSISNEVSNRSQGLMVAYLKMHHESPDAHLVRPLTPLKKDFVLSGEDLAFLESKPDMKTLSKRVEEIEKAAGTENNVPPLIPIYVGLGARFFKFNLDADFNSLDGFIVVDLSKLSVEALKPYMGDDGAGDFLRWHAENPTP